MHLGCLHTHYQSCHPRPRPRRLGARPNAPAHGQNAISGCAGTLLFARSAGTLYRHKTHQQGVDARGFFFRSLASLYVRLDPDECPGGPSSTQIVQTARLAPENLAFQAVLGFYAQLAMLAYLALMHQNATGASASICLVQIKLAETQIPCPVCIGRTRHRQSPRRSLVHSYRTCDNGIWYEAACLLHHRVTPGYVPGDGLGCLD